MAGKRLEQDWKWRKFRPKKSNKREKDEHCKKIE